MSEPPQHCVICLDEFDEASKLITLPCHSTHTFHINCIRKWDTETKGCPICREPTKNPFGTTENREKDIEERIIELEQHLNTIRSTIHDIPEIPDEIPVPPASPHTTNVFYYDPPNAYRPNPRIFANYNVQQQQVVQHLPPRSQEQVVPHYYPQAVLRYPPQALAPPRPSAFHPIGSRVFRHAPSQVPHFHRQQQEEQSSSAPWRYYMTSPTYVQQRRMPTSPIQTAAVLPFNSWTMFDHNNAEYSYL